MEYQSENPVSSNRLIKLSPALRDLVKAKGLEREFSAGEVIVDPANGGDSIRLIVSGKASLVLRDDEGEKIAATFLVKYIFLRGVHGRQMRSSLPIINAR